MDPEQLLGLLDGSLRETACAVLDPDDARVATDAELLSRLQHHLALACQDKPTTVVDRLAGLARVSTVILRVGTGVSTGDSAVAPGHKQILRCPW